MKLIMFKGGVETLEFFSMEMSEYFCEKGYEIFWYNLLLGASEEIRLREFIERNRHEKLIAITFNYEGIAGEDGLYNDNKNIWDENNIRVINIVVDHPLYYHKYLELIPKDYYQINIDRKHVEYIRHFYPEIKNVSFLPTAGTNLNKNHNILEDKDYLSMDERPYDIVFVGNFTPNSILKKYIENMGEPYTSFYNSALTYAINNPKKSIDEIGHFFLTKEIPAITDLEFREAMQTFMYVDLSVRFHYRELMIKALLNCGFNLVVVGEGFNYMNLESRKNLIELGGGDTQKCLKAISQAKIALNVMPWFKDGSHDRIYSSMLNGAVVLTDSSKYLDEEVLTRDNSIVYDLDMLYSYEKSGFDLTVLRDFSEKIRHLLNDKKRLSKMANTAFKQASTRDTWEMRAKEIENFF